MLSKQLFVILPITCIACSSTLSSSEKTDTQAAYEVENQSNETSLSLPGQWDGKTMYGTENQSDVQPLPYEECQPQDDGSEYCTTMDFYLDIHDDLGGILNTQTPMGPMDLSLDIEETSENT